MTDHEATPAAGAIDRLTELVDATGDDRRARRRLLDRASRVLAADAEADRRARAAITEADSRAKAVEAQAEARIRAAEARLRVQERERAADRAEREAGRAEQVAAREARAELAEVRRETWARRRAALGATAPAVLSMIVYCAAVASAVFGQVSVAIGRYDWSPLRALLLAGFIELMALAMATTANWLRLRGERALAPRVLTWVFACFAASVNVWGHLNDPLMATGLGAASLGGITLWEIRSSARHRDALRRIGQVAEPLPPLGLRFWLLQPAVAVAAYQVGVRTRVSSAAAPLVAQAEAERTSRKEARAARRPRTALWVTASFSAGLAAAVLGTTSRPDLVATSPGWWMAGTAGTAVLLGTAALIRGRRPGLVRPTPSPTAPLTVPSTVPSGRTAPAQFSGAGAPSGATPSMAAAPPGAALPPSSGQSPAPDHAPVSGLPTPIRSEHALPAEQPVRSLPAGPAPQTTPPVPVPAPAVPAPANGHAGTSAARAVGASQASPRAQEADSAPPALLSATGEFRALTAPEHYGRDAVGGERRATPRKSGIPVEAREWITEQLRAGKTPTGPEIGRRFRVDPSTGRRWTRQVRDSLAQE